jgi:transposase-like protein
MRRKARTLPRGKLTLSSPTKMSKAADIIEQTVQETLTYYAFPDIHWQKIRTNNPLAVC